MALAGSSQLMSDQGYASLTNSDSFKYETKAVVLNFMGLLSTPEGRAVESSGSSSGDARRPLRSQTSYSSIDSGPPMPAQWSQSLTDLPELSMMEKFNPNHEHSTDEEPARLSRQGTFDLESPRGTIASAPALLTTSIEEDDVDIADNHLHNGSASLGVNMPKSPKKSPMFKRRSTDASDVPPRHIQKARSPNKPRSVTRPHTLPGLPAASGDQSVVSKSDGKSGENISDGVVSKGDMTEDSGGQTPHRAERQISDVSGTSEISIPLSDDSSLMTSGRSLVSASSSFISVRTCDVETLVKSKALPPTAITLKEELNKEWQELEKGKGATNLTTPDEPDGRAISPETEVADYLRVIGDRVNAEYGAELDRATHDIMQMPREKVTYEILRQLAVQLLEQTSGWTRVALLLLLGQRIAWSLLSRGERGISLLVDYVARLIEDNMAEFIISRGGWHSLAEDKDIVTPMSAMDIQTQFPATDSPSSEFSHNNSTLSPPTDVPTDSESHHTTIPMDRDTTIDSLASLTTSPPLLPNVSQNDDQGFDIVDRPMSPPTHVAPPTHEAPPPLMIDEETQANILSDEECTDVVSPDLATEIGFYRRESVRLSEELHEEQRRADWLSLGLGVVGVSIISIAAYFAYKRLSK